MPFPKDFLWGVATSAAQIEGGWQADGRSPSIWDTFAQKPGKILGGETPFVACDSYHQWRRDVENLKRLGVNSYRLSISWSRVLPQGTGALNAAGVDYYKRLFYALQEAGITPNVTLYHWDLPQVLEDKGGWRNRDSLGWFGEYAEKMFAAFGELVPMWATVNEPIATYVGYALGGFAPGYTDERGGNQARHNLLVAHGSGVEAFRAAAIPKGKIGIVIDIWKRHALTDSPADAALVRDEDERNWKFYTDPIFAGHYSDYILQTLEKEGTLMEIGQNDYARMSQPLDFYGLNVYNRVVVSTDQRAKADFSQGGNFLNNRTEYYPRAVYDALHLLRDLYGLRIPIYITENGTYYEGDEPVDARSGRVEDDDRIRYLSGFLDWLEKALDEGFDVRGYYLWSLMDNFEWSSGTNFKFGLMKTDFEKLTCTPKKSFAWYRDFIRAHGG